MQQHVFTIAEVCALYGVTHAVICPGSRSAPLVYAFTQNKNFTCLSVIDERSAGFIALGLAQQQQRPVVLICTSGTATLNFFPAVAEAFYQKIPLLVLSADRPPELLNQQDGQMIMQKGVFGKHVLSSHELLCYDEHNAEFHLTERIVCNAIDACLSEKGFGPVHINVPLREPLYSLNPPKTKTDISPVNLLKRGAIQLPNFEGFMAAWKHSRKKLILIGQWPSSSALTEAINTLCKNHQVVILADITANQYAPSTIPNFDLLLKVADAEQLKALEPDFILSFGGPMVSKSLKTWLKSIKPTWHFRLQPIEETIDTWGNVTNLICAPEIPYVSAIAKQKGIKTEDASQFQFAWKKLQEQTEQKRIAFHAQKTWCEPSSVDQVINFIPNNSILQVGNSSAIRWVSWNANGNKSLEIYCNRGTSGIDGSMSTAVGAAMARPDKLVYLIIGDISFIYDEHALWIQNKPQNLKIIVLNNQGGNIFKWIEGPSNFPESIDYFTTPTTRPINQVCMSYAVQHHLAENPIQLQEVLVRTEKNTEIAAIELDFKAQESMKAIRSFFALKLD